MFAFSSDGGLYFHSQVRRQHPSFHPFAHTIDRRNLDIELLSELFMSPMTECSLSHHRLLGMRIRSYEPPLRLGKNIVVAVLTVGKNEQSDQPPVNTVQKSRHAKNPKDMPPQQKTRPSNKKHPRNIPGCQASRLGDNDDHSHSHRLGRVYMTSKKFHVGDAVKNPEKLDDSELRANTYSGCPSYSYADQTINISSTTDAAMPHSDPCGFLRILRLCPAKGLHKPNLCAQASRSLILMLYRALLQPRHCQTLLRFSRSSDVPNNALSCVVSIRVAEVTLSSISLLHR
ncbi:hypothetical protein IW262DRAFT_994900 [Armillaria fumosa]|nr:hypothetical protein IW262DRAFT_994900 [Armillaria fumosa]